MRFCTPHSCYLQLDFKMPAFYQQSILMAIWSCISRCGACCHLDPAERPDLDKYLSAAELQLYLSMVGPDGWCINFDPGTRTCKVYAERPHFCRVTPEVFHDLYDIAPVELNDFAIACCEQQIEGVYGETSLEKLRFKQAITDPS